MKSVAALLCSCALTAVFVLAPARASFLVRLATRHPLGEEDRIRIIGEALMSETCNEAGLNAMAVSAAAIHRFDLASGVLTLAIQCSPNNAQHHLNLGQALFGIRQDGLPEMRAALAMEPANPIFLASIEQAENAVEAAKKR